MLDRPVWPKMVWNSVKCCHYIGSAYSQSMLCSGRRDCELDGFMRPKMVGWSKSGVQKGRIEHSVCSFSLPLSFSFSVYTHDAGVKENSCTIHLSHNVPHSCTNPNMSSFAHKRSFNAQFPLDSSDWNKIKKGCGWDRGNDQENSLSGDVQEILIWLSHTNMED